MTVSFPPLLKLLCLAPESHTEDDGDVHKQPPRKQISAIDFSNRGSRSKPQQMLSGDLIKASQRLNSKKDISVGRSSRALLSSPIPAGPNAELISDTLSCGSQALENFLSMASPRSGPIHRTPGSESGAGLPGKPRRRAPGRSQTVADLKQLHAPVQRWPSSLSRQQQPPSPQFVAMRPSQQDRSWASAATLAAAAVYAAAAKREAEAEEALSDPLKQNPSRAL